METVVTEFVGLESPGSKRAGAGGHSCQGLYHRPRDRRPTTAFVASHYNVDFGEHYLAPLLAARGYGFLGWNTRFRGAEPYFLLDQALVDIGAGVRWLREEAGVKRVVLLGNSGGGSLMAAYQSQAVEPNVRPLDGMRPAGGLDDLSAADLFVALAAHAGRPQVLTAWLDPSVTDENDELSVDPALDPYNPDNGPPFDETFQRRYRAAQRERNERITDWDLAELDRLRGGPAGDRLFFLHRTWADLRMIDPTLEPSDRPPNECYRGDPRRANYGIFGIGKVSTLRTWLSMWSLRTSQCAAEPHLRRITVPSLVVHATADTGVHHSDARALFDGLGAADKHLELLAGAEHYLRHPAGTRDRAADLLADWVAGHGD